MEKNVAGILRKKRRSQGREEEIRIFLHEIKRKKCSLLAFDKTETQPLDYSKIIEKSL